MFSTCEMHELLMQQLSKVPEPCSLAMGGAMNIREMGLIERVAISDGAVTVELCLTDPACVNYKKLENYITDVLRQLDFVRSVRVTHTTEVLWTPDRVKPANEQAIVLRRRQAAGA